MAFNMTDMIYPVVFCTLLSFRMRMSATDVSLLVQVMVLSAALSGIIFAVKGSVSSIYIVAEVILSDIFKTCMGSCGACVSALLNTDFEAEDTVSSCDVFGKSLFWEEEAEGKSLCEYC